MLDDFIEPLDQRWTQTCIGGGKLYLENSVLRMAFESARQGQYTNAQIDDYGNLPISAGVGRARRADRALHVSGSAALHAAAGAGFGHRDSNADGGASGTKETSLSS